MSSSFSLEDFQMRSVVHANSFSGPGRVGSYFPLAVVDRKKILALGNLPTFGC